MRKVAHLNGVFGLVLRNKPLSLETESSRICLRRQHRPRLISQSEQFLSVLLRSSSRYGRAFFTAQLRLARSVKLELRRVQGNQIFVPLLALAACTLKKVPISFGPANASANPLINTNTVRKTRNGAASRSRASAQDLSLQTRGACMVAHKKVPFLGFATVVHVPVTAFRIR